MRDVLDGHVVVVGFGRVGQAVLAGVRARDAVRGDGQGPGHPRRGSRSVHRGRVQTRRTWRPPAYTARRLWWPRPTWTR